MLRDLSDTIPAAKPETPDFVLTDKDATAEGFSYSDMLVNLSAEELAKVRYRRDIDPNTGNKYPWLLPPEQQEKQILRKPVQAGMDPKILFVCAIALYVMSK